MRGFVILGLIFGFAVAFAGMIVVAWLAAPFLVVGYFAIVVALIVAVARR